jgi:peptidoglycan/xylan/chitin deacetylase (PgdA/CDA1 family)
MYHRLGRGPLEGREAGEEWYAIDPEAFEQQLGLLYASAAPVGFDDLLTAVAAKGRLPSRAVALSFDDGNNSDHEVALAALCRRGLRAAFFITPAWVGTPGYLRWEQVRELVASGMTVGAHGLDHTLLDGLHEKELRVHLREARRLLEARLGRAPDVLSLPGGRGGHRAVAAARDVGFRWVLGSVPRRLSPSRLSGELPRFAVRRGDSLETLRGVVTQHPLHLSKAIARHQLLEGARVVLGGSLYHRTRKVLGHRTA